MACVGAWPRSREGKTAEMVEQLVEESVSQCGKVIAEVVQIRPLERVAVHRRIVEQVVDAPVR